MLDLDSPSQNSIAYISDIFLQIELQFDSSSYFKVLCQNLKPNQNILKVAHSWRHTNSLHWIVHAFGQST